MVSEAQKKAIAKYHSNFDEMKIRVPKGDRERYKALADRKGTSLAQLIISLLEQDLKAEKN